MTDEQIIKALGCCGMRDCGKCPYVGFKEECSNLSILALDLIDRLRAKNEREINQIKSEAIKEFAERLKAISDSRPLYDELVYIDEIEEVVKEMEEEA